MADTWPYVCSDLKQIKLAQLFWLDGTVWQVSEPRPEAGNRLKSLTIDNPPVIVDHA